MSLAFLASVDCAGTVLEVNRRNISDYFKTVTYEINIVSIRPYYGVTLSLTTLYSSLD